MKPIAEVIAELKDAADTRYDNFRIEEISSIKRINEDTYLEAPVWVGGDALFVCLFIDLDNSSKMSFKKHAKTMAKIYDYFTQSLIDVLSEDSIHAEYIDIKGDGAFGIFEGDDAAFRALSASITFSSFFRKYIKPKFQDEEHPFNFKAAIHTDKILVKRIGRRGARKNNEVWAGRLVNGTAKLASLSKEIYPIDPNYSSQGMGMLIVSDEVFSIFRTKEEFAVMHCGHDLSQNKVPPGKLWKDLDTSQMESVHDQLIHYAPAIWCELCQDKVNSGLLE